MKAGSRKRREQEDDFEVGHSFSFSVDEEGVIRAVHIGIDPETITPKERKELVAWAREMQGVGPGVDVTLGIGPEKLEIWSDNPGGRALKKDVVELYKVKEIGSAPSSSSPDTSGKGMGEDFDIAAKAAARLANYQFLVGNVDLENSALPLAVQRSRANRLLRAYDRVQEVKRDFQDNNAQLTAARRIKQARHRELQRADRPPARRGRPPKHLAR
jgi:hypothetical protein